MAKKIAICNQKGGVGKSCTTANIAAALARTGKAVLMIDMDPQFSLVESFAIDPLDPQYNGMSTRDLFRPGIDPLDCIFTVDSVGDKIKLFIVPATQDLAVTAKKITGQSITRFKQNIAKIEAEDYFDYIIFDNPPDLGDLLTSSLVSADLAVIPVKPDKLSVAGLNLILSTIKAIQEAPDNQPHNHELKVAGVIANMYRAVSAEHKKYVEQLAVEHDLLGIVPLSTIVTKELDRGLPCVIAHPTSNAAKAFINIAMLFS